MNTYGIGADAKVAPNNGNAFALVSGGTTTFIPRAFSWFTGARTNHVITVMVQAGVDPALAIAITIARGALDHAATNVAGELGPLVGAGALRLMAPEAWGDGDLNAYTDFTRLDPAEVNDARIAAIAVAAGGGVAAGAAPLAPYAVDRLPPTIARVARSEETKNLAGILCKAAYTIIACNAVGLITAGHHLKGSGESVFMSISKLYGLDRAARDCGIGASDWKVAFGHHFAHPIDYTHIVAWGQAIPPAAAAKIAPPATLRLPSYPGGVAFVRSAMACRDILRSAPVLATTWAALGGIASPGDARLTALDVAVRAAPLNYSQHFNLAAWQGNKATIDACHTYAVAVFGAHDAWKENSHMDMREGPTTGEGIKRLIAAFPVAYSTAKSQTIVMINAAAGALPAANLQLAALAI